MVLLSKTEDSVNELHSDLDYISQKTFWSFSTKLYNRKLIKESCNCLKHKYGLSVNLIMFCCWAAVHDYPILTQDDFAYIANKIMPWNGGVVESLKRIYARLLDNDSVPHISKILETLLENILLAEKTEQSLILQSLDELKKGKEVSDNKNNVALRNLFNYINSQRIAVHKIDLEKVYSIVTECFTDDYAI